MASASADDSGGGLPRSVRIGTRGSPLARWQADWTADALRSAFPGLEVELIEIRTEGDRDRNSPLAVIGGQGVFTKEIQRALIEGRVDVAVHSLKDLPTTGPGELVLAATPPREASGDALIAPRFRTLEALPKGATVGTGSLRRRAQLLHLRPDLNVVGIRGNVETRLARAADGDLDGVVLAEAGLRRLGLDGRITDRLVPPRFLPAVGQGSLGIEARADDDGARRLLRALDDPATHCAVVAERRVLAELEGGCLIPLGVHGRVEADGRLALDAAVFDAEGREKIAAAATGRAADPDGLGRAVASRLRELGAMRLLGRK